MNSVNDYIELGHKILDEKYWNKWEKIVEEKLNSRYQGKELEWCAKVIAAIRRNRDMNAGLRVMLSQNHTSHSWKTVKSMIRVLCDEGPEFTSWFV